MLIGELRSICANARHKEANVNPKELKNYLFDEYRINYSVQTFAKMRCQGRGPKFQKIGPWVNYTREAGDEFALSIISPEVQSTSELPQRRSNMRATASAEPGTESSAPPNHPDAGAQAA